MRKFLIGLSLAILSAPSALAQTETLNPEQAVIRSSATVVTILISSSAPTLVDSPQLAGSFVAEIQNRDDSNSVCCAFDSVFSTVTTSAQARGCRQIPAGGSWSISRWWQNLRIYCQTLGITGTSPLAVTQGK